MQNALLLCFHWSFFDISNAVILSLHQISLCTTCHQLTVSLSVCKLGVCYIPLSQLCCCLQLGGSAPALGALQQCSLVIFTLHSEKTLGNLKFEVENNMKREDMSTGRGHEGLVSLPVLPLEGVKAARHNWERRLDEVHHCPASTVHLWCLGDWWENEELGNEDIKNFCYKQAWN